METEAMEVSWPVLQNPLIVDKFIRPPQKISAEPLKHTGIPLPAKPEEWTVCTNALDNCPRCKWVEMQRYAYGRKGPANG